MRYGIIIGIVVGVIGCGDVTSLMIDAGDAGASGAAGAGGSGGMAVAGTMGTAGATGGGGAGGSCVENTRIECRNVGTALVAAQYACHDDGYSEAVWGTCTNGSLVGYYSDLPCPFDVGIVNTVGWSGPAPEATNGTIITNGGGSTSAVWTNTADTIYCCDGNTVRKIARSQ